MGAYGCSFMFEIAHPTAGLPQSHYCCQHQRNVPGTVCLIDSDECPMVAIWGYPTTNGPHRRWVTIRYYPPNKHMWITC